MAIDTPQAGDTSWAGSGGTSGTKLNDTLEALDTAVEVVAADLATEEGVRAAADTALDGRVDALEAPPTAMLRQTTTQSISNNAFTAITFTTEDWDTHAGHSTSSDTTRYVVPTGWAGKYLLSGGVGFPASANGGRGTAWKVNGNFVNAGQSMEPNNGTGLSSLTTAKTIQVQLAVGDIVELFGYQDSGGSLSTTVSGSDQSFMSVLYLRS